MTTEHTPHPAPAKTLSFKNAAKPVSDLDLQALVDGQLDHRREAIVRRTIKNDSSARTRYRELLEQKQLLIAWSRQFS